jgi:hypothetical protein
MKLQKEIVPFRLKLVFYRFAFLQFPIFNLYIIEALCTSAVAAKITVFVRIPHSMGKLA